VEETLDNKMVCDALSLYIQGTIEFKKPCGRHYMTGSMIYCPIEKYKKCEYVKGK